MKTKFNKITPIFLDEFNKNWLTTIHKFNYAQTQLLIGNRLRPQICLWGYMVTMDVDKINQKKLQDIASIAVSIELIHKASLLLDDWIDSDQERHGQPAFHVEYSPEEAVLLALNMISLSMVRVKDNIKNSSIVLPQHYFLCFSSLLETIHNMAQGALKELCMKNQDIFNTKLIYEISKLETSNIISNSLLIGYYVGLGEEQPDVQIVNKFNIIGEKCGYLFQAMNDLEFFANPEKLKYHKGEINNDILKNRKNLVLATLYEISTKNDQRKLQINPEKHLLALMEKYNVEKLFKAQFSTTFKNIQEHVIEMKNLDIDIEWIHGFLSFLEDIKKFGESRLKE